MPTTPDPLAQILALLTDPKTGLAYIASKVTPAVSVPIPIPVPAPTQEQLDELDAQAFIKKYTTSPAEFQTKYGVSYGQKLPELPKPLNPDKVSEYASQGYDFQGELTGNGPMCLVSEGKPEDLMVKILDDIAHGRKTWETGNGLVDADILAVGYKTGFLHTKGLYQSSFGADSQYVAAWYIGWDFPRFVSTLWAGGGQPSGGE